MNIKIGRGTGKHISSIFKVRDLCYEYNFKFKLNTVVCKYNYMEDMNEPVARLEPFRWKCFQVLIVKTENDEQIIDLEEGVIIEPKKKVRKKQSEYH